MCVHTYITACTFTQLLYELAVKCTLCCTALTNCAYVQFEVYTHCSAVMFHSVMEHIHTFHASWCSCPPLSPDRWPVVGGRTVCPGMVDGLAVVVSFPMDHKTVDTPSRPPYTDT